MVNSQTDYDGSSSETIDFERMDDRSVFPIGNLSKNESIEHMSRKLLNEAIIEQEKKYKMILKKNKIKKEDSIDIRGKKLQIRKSIEQRKYRKERFFNKNKINIKINRLINY